MTLAAGPAPGFGPLQVSAEVTEAEWDAYVSSQPAATRYHLWAWRGVFERAFGHETIYLAARRPAAVRQDDSRPNSMIAGVLPLVSFRSLLFGRFLVSLPFVNYGGVLADDEETERALLGGAREEALKRGARSIELRHTRRVFPDLPAKLHKVAMTLALPADADAAWRAFDNKLRNQIRKAQRGNLEAVVGGGELLSEFYSVFASNMRNLGTPVYSRRLFQEVVVHIPDSRVFVVRLSGRPVAGGITVGYGEAVENPWASSLREHRSLNPNMLLYWTMIQDAIARGYRVFDFGRSTRDEGTYHFKKQWGSVENPFYWEYALREGKSLPDQSRKSRTFRLAVSAWKRLPLSFANAAGPILVRNIP